MKSCKREHSFEFEKNNFELDFSVSGVFLIFASNIYAEKTQENNM